MRSAAHSPPLARHTHTHRVKVVRPLLPSFLPSFPPSLSLSFLPSFTHSLLPRRLPARLPAAQPGRYGHRAGAEPNFTSTPNSSSTPLCTSTVTPTCTRQASKQLDGWMDALTPSVYYYTLPCTIFTYSVLLLLLLQVRIALFDLGNRTIKLS